MRWWWLSILSLTFSLLRSLDPIPTLDDIRFQRDGTRSAVQFEEQSAGITQHGAIFVASP